NGDRRLTHFSRPNLLLAHSHPRAVLHGPLAAPSRPWSVTVCRPRSFLFDRDQRPHQGWAVARFLHSESFTLMKRKSSRKTLESLCGQPSAEDGLDPRHYFKQGRSKRDSRKDWQLCRQIFETLNYVLSGDSHDEVLQGLLVSEVVPAPDATRVLVTVQA